MGISRINNIDSLSVRLIASALCLFFLVSLFKHISYPLFWADESITVMHGKRVLEFGYPKVHDGKNVLYDLRHPDKMLGIDPRTDAFIGGANWGMYYFATVGVTLAGLADDLYVRTGIIRATFAMAGLTGLVFLAALGARFFLTRISKAGFLSLFILFGLLSVPLVLHLREVRYYPLAVLLLSLAVFFYVRWRILHAGSHGAYAAGLTVSLLLLYITYVPAYAGMVLSVVLFEVWGFARRRTTQAVRDAGSFGGLLKALYPVIASLVLAAPLMLFFRTSHIAGEMLTYNTFIAKTDGVRLYLANIARSWSYFALQEGLFLAIALKTVLLLVRGRAGDIGLDEATGRRRRFSSFLSILFVVQFLVTAGIPNPLFTRYVIHLQPILSLIIIMDAVTVHSMLTRREPVRLAIRLAVPLLVACGMVVSIAGNWGNLTDHVYELTHRYRGPLDHVIPYVRDAYKDTTSLVIATNYEESSFMYYLDAKVTVGFVGNNLEEDARGVPDVIVFRRGWRMHSALFEEFLQRAHYERTVLPALDSPMNNIPELNWLPPYRHRFADEWTTDESQQVAVYRRTRN